MKFHGVCRFNHHFPMVLEGAAVGRELPRPQDVWSSPPRFQRDFLRGAVGTPRHLPQRKAPPSGSRQIRGKLEPDSTKWGPQTIAFSWFITPITMVYGTYSIHGVYKTSSNWGAPHCMA